MMRRRDELKPILVILGGLMLTACTSPSIEPPSSPSRSPEEVASAPLPGQPIPGLAEIFPSPRPSATVEPDTVCSGERAELQASRLPAHASLEVWINDITAGGWKIGNPPRPEEFGATKLGSATTDAEGKLTFSFELTEEIVAKYGKEIEFYELWLVYPESEGKTPIQPTAAAFKRCGVS